MNTTLRAVYLKTRLIVKKSMSGWICLGLIFFTACGHRTPPYPIPPQTSFDQLAIIQRGEQLRLSWVMQQPIPKDSGSQQFQIETSTLDPQCLQCEPESEPPRILPFPSKQFTFDGNRVHISLVTEKDLKIHTYKITHQDGNGNPLSPPQVVNFTKFVEFPPLPTMQWHFLPTSTLPKLDQLPGRIPPQAKDIRLLRLSWQPQQEKVEFYFSNQGKVVQNPRYYRINIYKTAIGTPWPDRPINGQPVAEAFYIDYQLKTKHAFLYQIRLVDSQGNESGLSNIYTISPQS